MKKDNRVVFRERATVVSAGGAGVAFAIICVFASRETLVEMDRWSIGLFCAAIPLFIGILYSNQHDSGCAAGFVYISGLALFTGGFFLFLCGLGKFAAIPFLIAAGVCALYLGMSHKTPPPQTEPKDEESP